VRELQVWHTEVEPQTVKTIQDTSIAEFERKVPGFKVRQQALGWGDLNTKLLASLSAGSPPDLTHLNPFMTASLYTKNLLRPMDELIRALGENDIHEATRKLQYFDGKYYGVTHAMGATYFCERRDLREKKGLKASRDICRHARARRGAHRGRPLRRSRCRVRSSTWASCTPAEWMASNGGAWVDAKTWRPQLNSASMLETLDYLQKLNKFQSQGWSGQKYLDTQAALATGKIAMSYLSGARAIGYIEKYAPEGTRDPEHFHADAAAARPRRARSASPRSTGRTGPSSASPSTRTRPFEFLRLFYKKEHYLQYCHSVPIHLTPIFKSMLGDPAYLANERIKKWRAWHDVMLTGLRGNRFMPLGFTRPEDNLLPFLAELDGLEHRRGHGRGGHGRRQEPKAEADRAQKRAEELLTQLGHKRWS
jgi:multiple sugar transport system substrate-binding protein